MIPEADRLEVHAFTRPSQQHRLKVRAATLHRLYNTSLFRRLILLARDKGARTKHAGVGINRCLRSNHKKGTTSLKFAWEQLFNGKVAQRYGQASTDACSRCALPVSCTHIVGECKENKTNCMSRHNAASQLIHATIRNLSKQVGHSTSDPTSS